MAEGGGGGVGMGGKCKRMNASMGKHTIGAMRAQCCVPAQSGVRVFRVDRADFPMYTSASNCPLEVSCSSTECSNTVTRYFIFLLKVIVTEMATLLV